MAGKPKIVRVACSVPNGLHLQLLKQGYEDGTGSGVKHMVRLPGGVTLAGPSSLAAGAGNTSLAGAKPRVTKVDAGFWAEWAKQNARNPVLEQGLVKKLDDEEPGEGKA